MNAYGSRGSKKTRKKDLRIVFYKQYLHEKNLCLKICIVQNKIIHVYIYETWSGHDHDLSLDSSKVVLSGII